ncbi:hypothetical protein PR048_031115 [Dryococelus australis]|uniref:Major facilitator superfamily (MFS) profile domain-containing protein n=1 Tax=Dryococelus australis TaxID=614101 RepID=A0ABQ9G8F7_9NEOP|nr:hypothetical protein PR048_031115 [Dryococelus australis]
MEQVRDTGGRVTGDPRENPPTSGIVRHDSDLRKKIRERPHWNRSWFALALCGVCGEVMKCGVCTTATLMAFCGGTSIAWTSPSAPLLQAEGLLSETQVSWLGSLLSLGAVLGAPPAGLLLQRRGRRGTLLLLGVPFLLSYTMLLVFRARPGLLYVARLLAGVSLGGLCVATPVYIAEVAEDSVRGQLGSFFQVRRHPVHLTSSHHSRHIRCPQFYVHIPGRCCWSAGFIACFPRPFVPALFHTYHTPPSLALKTSMLRASQSFLLTRSSTILTHEISPVIPAGVTSSAIPTCMMSTILLAGGSSSKALICDTYTTFLSYNLIHHTYMSDIYCGTCSAIPAVVTSSTIPTCEACPALPARVTSTTLTALDTLNPRAQFWIMLVTRVVVPPQMMFSCGILFVHLLGLAGNYFLLGVGCLLTSLLSMAVLYWMPETPHHHLARSRKHEAMCALQWLRGGRRDVSEELRALQVGFSLYPGSLYIWSRVKWHSGKPLGSPPGGPGFESRLDRFDFDLPRFPEITPAGETGDPRENPSTSGIVRRDSHVRKSWERPRRESNPLRLGGVYRRYRVRWRSGNSLDSHSGGAGFDSLSGHPDFFHGFLKSLQANAGMPWPIPSPTPLPCATCTVSNDLAVDETLSPLTYLPVSQVHVDEASHVAGTWRDLVFDHVARKALAISLGLLAFQQLSGICAVLYFTETIFEEAGGLVAPATSSVVVGAVMLAAAYVGSLLVDRLGRRFLLMFSSCVLVLSLTVLGGYFYVKELALLRPEYTWVPLASAVLYVVAYSVSLGPLPWTVMAELLPPNVKGLGGSLASSFCWLLSFVVAKTFQDMKEVLGMYFAFWCFSFFCFVAVPFVHFFVPETKGKSLHQIQEELGRGRRGISRSGVISTKSSYLNGSPDTTVDHFLSSRGSHATARAHTHTNASPLPRSFPRGALTSTTARTLKELPVAESGDIIPSTPFPPLPEAQPRLWRAICGSSLTRGLWTE